MARNLISLKSLAARALCKKTMSEINMKGEQFSPDLVVAMNGGEEIISISNINETLAFSMANMPEFSHRTNLIIHLVYKETKIEYDGQAGEIPDFSKTFIVFPTREAKLEIESVADEYGGLEISMKLSNGLVDPDYLTFALIAYRRLLRLKGKLKGIKSTFQFLRPKREDAVEGRGFRVSFKPRRKESLTTLQTANYIRYY